MPDMDVRISDRSDPFNNIILEVTRTLDRSESDQLRRLMAQAWNDGYDSCRMERDRQESDPAYPLHRRNPYSDDLTTPGYCCDICRREERE